MHHLFAAHAALVLAGVALALMASAARAGEAVVLWSKQSCEMALVEKPGGEFGCGLNAFPIRFPRRVRSKATSHADSVERRVILTLATKHA